MDSEEIMVFPEKAVVPEADVPTLLKRIRPHWQAKSLIHRVYRLLDVDPSSACQRIFNAAIHDLREKVAYAGIDVAEQAAKLNKLPPISRAEDLENYSTSKLIDLSYRMGLLTRPEWRRISRCYEIRRDLEHEDDQYEAVAEDCVYMFSTCINVVLSKDPVRAIKISDVKSLIDQPEVAEPTYDLLEDYVHAPHTRQEEICKFLISTTLDNDQLDIVRNNAYRFLIRFSVHTHHQVKAELARHLQAKIKRDPLSILVVRVSIAAGLFGYLREKQRIDFFNGFLEKMREVGVEWRAFKQHGDLLRDFKDCGGLKLCPSEIKGPVIKWLILTYLGTPGGMTSYGHVRHVFYSNTAEPIIEELFRESGSELVDYLDEYRKHEEIESLCRDSYIARRFENLLDFVEARG